MARKDKLVPIAEFIGRDVAEQAWGLLEDAGIPANVLTEPGTFGTPVIHRIEVERPNVTAAQTLIAHLVLGERSS
ncbi:MAG: hypothetical protein QNJ77_03825 [Acidimicrobiia bacterium]|nr:hypothetical protein [Acidimicrobiia bacterium]